MWLQNCVVLVLITFAFGIAAAAKPEIEYRVIRVAQLISAGRAINTAGATVDQGIGKGIDEHGHIVGTSDHLGPCVYRGRKMESLNALIDPAGR